MSDGPKPPERRFFALLSQAHRRVWRAAEQECTARLGVSPAQLGALYAVRPGTGTPQSEVGQALDLSPAALTGLIDRMVEAGLIERQRAANDGRAVFLHLTPKGEAIRTQSFPLLAELNAALTDGFTEEELDTVSRFLTHIIRRCSSAESLFQSEGSSS